MVRWGGGWGTWAVLCDQVREYISCLQGLLAPYRLSASLNNLHLRSPSSTISLENNTSLLMYVYDTANVPPPPNTCTVCLAVCISSLCPTVCLYTCLSASLSVSDCFYVCLNICLYFSLCPSVSLSVPVCLSLSVSLCLSVRLSISLCPSLCAGAGISSCLSMSR